MFNKRRFRVSDVLAMSLVICLVASLAFAQSGSRSETGATPSDLQLSGPANNAPAPAQEIDIPSVDDAITRDAPKTPDVDSFIAADTPMIPDLDPDRQGKSAPAADLSPKLSQDDLTAKPKVDVAPPAPAPEHTTAKAVDVAAGDVAELKQRVARLESLVEQQKEMLNELKTAQAQMNPADDLKAIREEIVALRKSFQTVGRPDFDGGSTSDEPTSPAVGMLVVENLTGVGYTMNVIGYDIVVMPGRQEVPIEVGNVITEIRGFEAPRAWNADNFRDVNGQRQLAIQIR